MVIIPCNFSEVDEMFVGWLFDAMTFCRWCWWGVKKWWFLHSKYMFEWWTLSFSFVMGDDLSLFSWSTSFGRGGNGGGGGRGV